MTLSSFPVQIRIDGTYLRSNHYRGHCQSEPGGVVKGGRYRRGAILLAGQHPARREP
jgi:hypothetical protein